MGLFNKLFTKSHEPYDLKGRWYKISISIDAQGMIFNHPDIPVIDPSSFPDVPFGMAIDSNSPSQVGIFKGIILDMKVFPLKGNFTNSNAKFIADTKNNPIPVSTFGLTTVAIGDVYDVYLYVVRCNTLPDV